NLALAENAALILPVHQALDKALEASRGKVAIGTTGRGIGPAYEDKIGRRAIRVCDLEYPDLLKEKIEALLLYHNAFLKGAGAELLDPQVIYKSLMEIREEILSYSGVSWKILDEAQSKGKKILFEGAQGTMLDVDHGTYPFVTSSNIV